MPVITAPITMKAVDVMDKKEGEWSPVTRFVPSPGNMRMMKPFFRIGECEIRISLPPLISVNVIL